MQGREITTSVSTVFWHVNVSGVEEEFTLFRIGWVVVVVESTLLEWDS